jgi:hypothetical protein
LTWRLTGAVGLPRRELVALAIIAAAAAGAGVGWAAGGLSIVVGSLAAPLAAANGFSKAYSP